MGISKFFEFVKELDFVGSFWVRGHSSRGGRHDVDKLCEEGGRKRGREGERKVENKKGMLVCLQEKEGRGKEGGREGGEEREREREREGKRRIREKVEVKEGGGDKDQTRQSITNRYITHSVSSFDRFRLQSNSTLSSVKDLIDPLAVEANNEGVEFPYALDHDLTPLSHFLPGREGRIQVRGCLVRIIVLVVRILLRS